MSAVRAAGVDGCPGGWAVFAIEGDEWTFEVVPDAKALVQQYGGAGMVLIDMPIGLPETLADARPDGAARQALKGRTSTIFNCPCRQAVYALPEEASRVNEQVLGKRLSYQSVSLIPKIRQLDMLLRQQPELNKALVESHPELCFAKLSGAPVEERKRTPEGLERRLDILAQVWPPAYKAFSLIRVPKSKAAPDDVTDAMCLAVTGWLALRTSLKFLPPVPQYDACGLPMRMAYATP